LFDLVILVNLFGSIFLFVYLENAILIDLVLCDTFLPDCRRQES